MRLSIINCYFYFFFNIIQEEIEVAINDTKPHADTLRKVLFGPTITVKANKTFLNVSA
jgi:hypothetical protein